VNPTLVQIAYLAAAVLFMVAIVATLLVQQVVSYEIVAAGMLVGGGIGAVMALRIAMTAMPQMVAILNGFGGAASGLVSGAELLRYARLGETPEGIVPTAIVLGALIGWVTFTGSLVAFAKLQELMRGAPITYPGQQVVNGLLAVGVIALCVLVALDPGELPLYWGVVGVAALLGVLLVIPIGGADMPVVISLLNSYSGLAACATGFVLGNSGLVISGSLVGASGLILTKIMCDAMNRPLTNVLFGAFGAPVEKSAAASEQRDVKAYTPTDAAVIFSSAQTAIIVPGYGMAVAQAQHAVRELAEELESRGIKVQFAIHPVAGRMPGHMNVLLAEADVPYEKLVEMDDINPQFPETDVALVLGANDVVNPAAREDPQSPIAGMPVLEVDRARHVFVIKRSMNPGFAGIDNPLFYKDNTMMVFGDAKETVLKITEAVRDYES
jgi:NAD(P) transhydrogenase subunit beta